MTLPRGIDLGEVSRGLVTASGLEPFPERGDGRIAGKQDVEPIEPLLGLGPAAGSGGLVDLGQELHTIRLRRIPGSDGDRPAFQYLDQSFERRGRPSGHIDPLAGHSLGPLGLRDDRRSGDVAADRQQPAAEAKSQRDGRAPRAPRRPPRTRAPGRWSERSIPCAAPQTTPSAMRPQATTGAARANTAAAA